MSQSFEEAVVICKACGNQFKNNPSAIIEKYEKKYYACSGECKYKIYQKAEKEKKDNVKKNMINDRWNNNQFSGTVNFTGSSNNDIDMPSNGA